MHAATKALAPGFVEEVDGGEANSVTASDQAEMAVLTRFAAFKFITIVGTRSTVLTKEVSVNAAVERLSIARLRSHKSNYERRRRTNKKVKEF